MPRESIKKKPLKKKTVKKIVKKKIKPTGKKVTVGEDEFCPTCMEWRAYDEATGKCRVCGRQIKKVGTHARTVTDEYDLKDFTVEHDEQQDTGEY